MRLRPVLLTATGSALAVLASLGAPVAQSAPSAVPDTSQLANLAAADLQNAANGCGLERWAIKTASDSQRNLVSTIQHPTTIAAMRALSRPASLPSSSRIRPTETTEYVVAGTLTGYKTEADGDLHLVITDGAGRTMIVELASPSCATASRFKTEITSVRRAFAARYIATSTMKNPHRAIRVRGIGFFDFKHRQTGVAPNGIELHPVLGLGFP